MAWTLNAEIFSPEAKRLGSSIAFSANWSFAFFVTYFEPDIEDALKTSGAYFLFSAICVFGKPRTPQDMDRRLTLIFAKS